jgi:formylmethanofuran dehydrogenase subunit E
MNNLLNATLIPELDESQNMNIQPFLELSTARHSHLCPRQVLGVRIGLLAARIFNSPPGENPKKRLLAIVESDGCFSDGIEVATGCTLGHRRLRLQDYGKIAATFVDTLTNQAVRITPRIDIRERAYTCVPQEKRHYFAQLEAYQIMPDDELLSVQEVALIDSVEQILSRSGVRVQCSLCGEEIINERELIRNGQTLCISCAGEGYYYQSPVAISEEFNWHSANQYNPVEFNKFLDRIPR